jgi:transglutaminase-like putative cysteine protease
MSKPWRVIALILVLALLVPVIGGCTQASEGQAAYEQAKQYETDRQFTKATKAYEEAMPLLEKEGKKRQAIDCRMALQRIDLFTMTYPHLVAEVKKELAEMYPQVSQAERDKWVSSGELEHMTWDGKVHYFDQAADNIVFRHMDVMRLNAEKTKFYKEFVIAANNKYAAPTTPTWQPYSKPNTYVGTSNVNIPRAELPKTGTFKMWWPLPVEMGPQDTVTLVSVTPDTYLKQPASLDGDISLAYLEVPLEGLDGNLNITVKFQWTHQAELYQVDPDNVGTYDKSDPMYKEYTRSYGNTRVSPAIKAAAKKAVGDEKNPYLAAKKLYDYVLDEIDYSFMPHGTLWPRGEAESVYVHRMKRGDCGAQSMYFTALCRSLGIPARTTGGWQLLSGNFGDHFWAEFFLPNYGWLPVDPTIAELALYPGDLDNQQRDTFIDFYFGGQDPMRCNVQLDVDEPLIPPAAEDVMLPLAIQEPAANCSTMVESPSVLVERYQTMQAELVTPPAGQ